MEPNDLRPNAGFRLHEFSVRPDLNRIVRGATAMQVEPRVMDVLVCLTRHPGEVVSREMLLDELWGDTVVVEHVLTRAISELRRILEDDAEHPRFIETIRKRGYRLVAPVVAMPLSIDAPAGAEPAALGPPRSVARASRRAALWWIVPGVGVAVAAVALTGRFTSREPNLAPVVLEAVPFTSYAGDERGPAFSPDGTRVAFVWTGENNDNADIYVKRLDVEIPLRLTDHPGYDLHPAWSPNGSTIAFARVASGKVTIHTLPSVGGVERQVYAATSSVRGLDWSPDGRMLVFSERPRRDEPYCLRTLDLATHATADLTDPPADMSDTSPAISPDARTVAFIRENLAGSQSIHVVPLAGGEARRVSAPLILSEGLVWRANGKEIVFTCSPAGPASLWTLDVAGGNATPLIVRDEWVGDPTCPRSGTGLVYETWRCQANVWEVDLAAEGGSREALVPVVHSTRWDGYARVSPDGASIAFLSARSGAAELWVCRRDGSEVVRLTSLEGQAITAPCWSPEGDRIAFSVSPGGFMAAHVIDVAGGSPRQVTFGEHNDRVCDWSPDGSRIYLVSDRSGEWEIWGLAPDGGEPRQLSRAGGIDVLVSRDGGHLYYLKPRGRGVWRMPAQGGAEELVFAGLDRGQRTNWAVHETRIYYFDHDREGPAVVCHDVRTGATETVLRFPGLAGPGIHVAPDGRTLLYARTDDAATDLKLVKTFL